MAELCQQNEYPAQSLSQEPETSQINDAGASEHLDLSPADQMMTAAESVVQTDGPLATIMTEAPLQNRAPESADEVTALTIGPNTEPQSPGKRKRDLTDGIEEILNHSKRFKTTSFVSPIAEPETPIHTPLGSREAPEHFERSSNSVDGNYSSSTLSPVPSDIDEMEDAASAKTKTDSAEGSFHCSTGYSNEVQQPIHTKDQRETDSEVVAGAINPQPPAAPSTSPVYNSVASFGAQRWSGRPRKQREFLGNLVPTMSVIEDLTITDYENVPSQDEGERTSSNLLSKRNSSTQERKKWDIKSKRTAPAPPKQEPPTAKSKIVKSKKVLNSSRKSGNLKDTKDENVISKAEKLLRATALGKWRWKTDSSFKEKFQKEQKKRKLQNSHMPVIPRVTLLLPNPGNSDLPDARLLELSRELTKRVKLDSKEEPRGIPDVWADSRQALCETLPYFKSPQSGCYQNDGHVYGFLFDSIGHCREYMGENVIICRAGGSMEPDGTGGMVQRKDHSMQEAQVQALLNDRAHHNPIVVICGNRNTAALCKMPHQYCVLGWYKPTHVWCEKTAGKGDKLWTTIKYRLERLNRHIPAWHASKDSQLSESANRRAVAGHIKEKTCDHCSEKSPQVYLRWWMCLNSTCSQFWKVNGANAPYEINGLEYDPSFLLDETELWNVQGGREEEPGALRPPVPNIGNAIGDNLTYINTRGVCCPKCGRCNSRRLFKSWICENPDCEFELLVPHQPVVPAMLHTPWDVAPTLVRNRRDRGVHLTIEYKHGYKLSVYTFDGLEGRFIHAAASKQVNDEENGPNAMFAALQIEDMGLERRAFVVNRSSHGNIDKSLPDSVQQGAPVSLVGGDTEAVNYSQQPLDPVQEPLDSQEPINDTSEIFNDQQEPFDQISETVVGFPEGQAKKQEFADGDLMTAFSMNFGMPYKFVATGASRPFKEGPWPVSETRRRLNWASKTFLSKTEEITDLNEELIFAYLEGQKIEYHDDGEEGLGPCIATLSLGGRAKMHLRMKMKHFVGCSKTGLFTEERPIPSSLEYATRLKKWNELQQLKDEPFAYNARRKEIPKELGIFEKRTKKADDLVTITLSHGDIVIMDGYDIQKYLEHKVVPEGYLRFALTCRTVLEHHLAPEERPAYEVKVDDQTYDGPKT